MTHRSKEANPETSSIKKHKKGTVMKVPKSFGEKCDVKKVNMEVMREWIASKLEEQLPDDDIVVDLVVEMLKSSEGAEIEEICEQMKGFLGDREAVGFCDEMWQLLVAAQHDVDGIPPVLVEARRNLLRREENKRKNNAPVASARRSQYNGSKRASQHKTQSQEARYSRNEYRSREKDTHYARNRPNGTNRVHYRADRRSAPPSDIRDRSPQRS